MDTQSILTLPQKHRRTFVGLLIALFAIALLLDWKLSTLPFIETLLGYIRAIAAAILTSLFLLWIVIAIAFSVLFKEIWNRLLSDLFRLRQINFNESYVVSIVLAWVVLG